MIQWHHVCAHTRPLTLSTDILHPSRPAHSCRPVRALLAAALVCAVMTVAVHLDVAVTVRLRLWPAVAERRQVGATARAAAAVAHPERRVPRLAKLHPVPALVAPQRRVLVATVEHELQELLVADRELARFECSHSTRTTATTT